MNTMKKTLLGLSLLISNIAFAQSPGGGGISVRDVMPELRTMHVNISGVSNRIIDESDGAWGTFTVGTDGVMASIAYATAIDQTTTFGVPFQPSKIVVGAYDNGSNSSITCSAFQVWGVNQFGDAVTETLSTNTNSTFEFNTTERAKGILSAKVYAKITRIKATCTATGTTTGDKIVVLATRNIGLPYHITSESAVTVVCYNRQANGATTAVGSTICLAPGTSDSATTFDASGSGDRVDISVSSLDLRTIHTTTGTIGGSIVASIRILARAGAR